MIEWRLWVDIVVIFGAALAAEVEQITSKVEVKNDLFEGTYLLQSQISFYLSTFSKMRCFVVFIVGNACDDFDAHPGLTEASGDYFYFEPRSWAYACHGGHLNKQLPTLIQDFFRVHISTWSDFGKRISILYLAKNHLVINAGPVWDCLWQLFGASPWWMNCQWWVSEGYIGWDLASEYFLLFHCREASDAQSVFATIFVSLRNIKQTFYESQKLYFAGANWWFAIKSDLFLCHIWSVLMPNHQLAPMKYHSSDS